MIVRRATIQDYDKIMEMMITFANFATFDPLHNPQYHDRHIRNLLTTFLKEGCILIGQTDQPDQPDQTPQIMGMLIAHIQSDPWLPHVKMMKEIAWWVQPEARGTSLGYKLLQEYIKIGKELQQAGTISAFTLTSMNVSGDLGLEKRGWKPVETNYIYEGV